ncbi:hypothetical protein VNI00_011838 [Paramarasmius palmivorus]|uniref:JmjC domain-containing protein n=1 Tax=Paramarasmius palmivorus TaxID=297713 RepID=A0AAW0C9S1_9AGAR
MRQRRDVLSDPANLPLIQEMPWFTSVANDAVNRFNFVPDDMKAMANKLLQEFDNLHQIQAFKDVVLGYRVFSPAQKSAASLVALLFGLRLLDVGARVNGEIELPAQKGPPSGRSGSAVWDAEVVIPRSVFLGETPKLRGVASLCDGGGWPRVLSGVFEAIDEPGLSDCAVDLSGIDLSSPEVSLVSCAFRLIGDIRSHGEGSAVSKTLQNMDAAAFHINYLFQGNVDFPTNNMELLAHLQCVAVAAGIPFTSDLDLPLVSRLRQPLLLALSVSPIILLSDIAPMSTNITRLSLLRAWYHYGTNRPPVLWKIECILWRCIFGMARGAVSGLDALRVFKANASYLLSLSLPERNFFSPKLGVLSKLPLALSYNLPSHWISPAYHVRHGCHPVFVKLCQNALGAFSRSARVGPLSVTRLPGITVFDEVEFHLSEQNHRLQVVFSSGAVVTFHKGAARRNPGITIDVLAKLGSVSADRLAVDFSAGLVSENSPRRCTASFSDFVKRISSPEGSIVYLPYITSDTQFCPAPSLSTDDFSSEYLRNTDESLSTTRSPENTLSWHLLATAHAFQSVPGAPEGFNVELCLSSGSVIVFLGLDDRNPNYLGDLDSYRYPCADLFSRLPSATSVLLRKGDRLYIPAGTPHVILALIPSLCYGRHFYSLVTVEFSWWSICHQFFTNVESALHPAVGRHEHFMNILLHWRDVLVVRFADYIDTSKKGDEVRRHVPDIRRLDGILQLFNLFVLLEIGDVLTRAPYQSAGSWSPDRSRSNKVYTVQKDILDILDRVLFVRREGCVTSLSTSTLWRSFVTQQYVAVIYAARRARHPTRTAAMTESLLLRNSDDSFVSRDDVRKILQNETIVFSPSMHAHLDSRQCESLRWWFADTIQTCYTIELDTTCFE